MGGVPSGVRQERVTFDNTDNSNGLIVGSEAVTPILSCYIVHVDICIWVTGICRSTKVTTYMMYVHCA